MIFRGAGDTCQLYIVNVIRACRSLRIFVADDPIQFCGAGIFCHDLRRDFSNQLDPAVLLCYSNVSWRFSAQIDVAAESDVHTHLMGTVVRRFHPRGHAVHDIRCKGGAVLILHPVLDALMGISFSLHKRQRCIRCHFRGIDSFLLVLGDDRHGNTFRLRSRILHPIRQVSRLEAEV